MIHGIKIENESRIVSRLAKSILFAMIQNNKMCKMGSQPLFALKIELKLWFVEELTTLYILSQ